MFIVQIERQHTAEQGLTTSPFVKQVKYFISTRQPGSHDDISAHLTEEEECFNVPTQWYLKKICNMVHD